VLFPRQKDEASSLNKPVFRYVTHTNPELPERCVVCREPLGAVSVGQKRHHRDLAGVKDEESAEKTLKLDPEEEGDSTGKSERGAGGSQVEELWHSFEANTSPASTQEWSIKQSDTSPAAAAATSPEGWSELQAPISVGRVSIIKVRIKTVSVGDVDPVFLQDLDCPSRFKGIVSRDWIGLQMVSLD
jgi:hypothetical protein